MHSQACGIASKDNASDDCEQLDTLFYGNAQSNIESASTFIGSLKPAEDSAPDDGDIHDAMKKLHQELMGLAI